MNYFDDLKKKILEYDVEKGKRDYGCLQRELRRKEQETDELTRKTTEDIEKKFGVKEDKEKSPELDVDELMKWFKSIKSILGIGGILILIISIFFLSTNLTGNTISSLTQNSSNLIGGYLFILGLIGIYYWKRR